jgi:hypothetical protein
MAKNAFKDDLSTVLVETLNSIGSHQFMVDFLIMQPLLLECTFEPIFKSEDLKEQAVLFPLTLLCETIAGHVETPEQGRRLMHCRFPHLMLLILAV